MDATTERCLDWVIETVIYDGDEVQIRLVQHLWESGPEEPPSATCFVQFADVQSYAVVDGCGLSHYSDLGDYQPLLQRVDHQPRTTHLSDHHLVGDVDDSGYGRYRVTAGDSTIEVLTRDQRKPSCLFKKL